MKGVSVDINPVESNLLILGYGQNEEKEINFNLYFHKEVWI